MGVHAVVASAVDRPGLLFQLTKVFADHSANITSVDIHSALDRSEIHFEFTVDDDAMESVVSDLRAIPGVAGVDETPSFTKIYGKRIVVMGGGAQVGFVAMGAIVEADRHNIRGERISIDTIPLVGERELAAAVRAVVRLPRAKLLVLAGSLMGGDITEAVEEVRQERPVRHLAQHARQRARRGRPRRDRSGPGRRHGRDGRRRHGEVRFDAAAEKEVLDRHRPLARILTEKPVQQPRVDHDHRDEHEVGGAARDDRELLQERRDPERHDPRVEAHADAAERLGADVPDDDGADRDTRRECRGRSSGTSSRLGARNSPAYA